MAASPVLTIGDLAARTGASISAIRFYETKGLLEPARSSGGRRLFLRSDIRRLSFVMIAQRLGYSISEIATLLAALPLGRTPNKADWTRMASRFQVELDERIAMMERLRERLDGCIGCGCLSLKSCKLYNPEDGAGALGAGPRYLLGDRPEDAGGG
ncbi:MAG: redox-sensitive transcriptional activator SoxR [Pseudomonadota bacterium]